MEHPREEPQVVCPDDGFTACPDLQLGEYMCDVGVHGARAEAEIVADFTICLSFCQVPQDVHFTRCQTRWCQAITIDIDILRNIGDDLGNQVAKWRSVTGRPRVVKCFRAERRSNPGQPAVQARLFLARDAHAQVAGKHIRGTPHARDELSFPGVAWHPPNGNAKSVHHEGVRPKAPAQLECLFSVRKARGPVSSLPINVGQAPEAADHSPGTS